MFQWGLNRVVYYHHNYLINAFLNGLTQCINELHCGVEYGDNSIFMLLCADGIILIASDEHKLQPMLDALNECCIDLETNH